MGVHRLPRRRHRMGMVGRLMPWFDNNFEAVMPTDPDEYAAYTAQLEHEAIHGPAAGQETNT